MFGLAAAHRVDAAVMVRRRVGETFGKGVGAVALAAHVEPEAAVKRRDVEMQHDGAGDVVSGADDVRDPEVVHERRGADVRGLVLAGELHDGVVAQALEAAGFLTDLLLLSLLQRLLLLLREVGPGLNGRCRSAQGAERHQQNNQTFRQHSVAICVSLLPVRIPRRCRRRGCR